MSEINLIKRGAKDSPLTWDEMDGNWGKIEDAIENIAVPNGAKILFGAAAPNQAAGNLGDVYINTSTYDVYQKEDTDFPINPVRWILKGNIKGEDGGSANGSGNALPPVLLRIDSGNNLLSYTTGLFTPLILSDYDEVCIALLRRGKKAKSTKGYGKLQPGQGWTMPAHGQYARRRSEVDGAYIQATMKSKFTFHNQPGTFPLAYIGEDSQCTPESIMDVWTYDAKEQPVTYLWRRGYRRSAVDNSLSGYQRAGAIFALCVAARRGNERFYGPLCRFEIRVTRQKLTENTYATSRKILVK